LHPDVSVSIALFLMGFLWAIRAEAITW